MRRILPSIALIIATAMVVVAQGGNQPPILYKVSFPEPEHHWMQVEITFSRLVARPLDVRMSRSSPGRYAVAEFAKNVFSVEAYNGKGQKLAYARPDADVWRVAGHDGTVRVVYKIFGDYPNGTYFGVDRTHAHLQMPAVFMWGVGHEDQPIQITFTTPSGLKWKVGTQLFTTGDPNTFSAPNLQYFMDSPVELSDFLTSTFTLPNSGNKQATFRLVVHADASQSDVDELTKMVERLVREQMSVFGEFPKYEPGLYTFLLDYVPWGAGDGMEHRNSTSISNVRVSLKTAEGRQQALGSISHEFFHSWNMERIRSAGLEPFDFSRENVTCCLWVGEGFTQYYGPLLLMRAGLGGRDAAIVASAADVINSPGRAVRSPVQMSEYAPFGDGAVSSDVTDASRTFLTYYTYGAGIALALDLSLREMSGGKISLDDYMKMLWAEYGKDGPAPGLVAKPYAVQDLNDVLAKLTNNRQFANDFFAKYIEGRDAPDYRRLLSLAGYSVEMNAGRGWLGNVPASETPNGLAVGVGNSFGGFPSRPAPVPFNTPLYEAGIDSGDTIRTIDGQPATSAAWLAIGNKKPGDQVVLGVLRRGGETIQKTITLKQDPTVRVVPIPNPSAAQKAFHDSWLATKSK
jgi:predicted metalloprotease with PDZ domain